MRTFTLVVSFLAANFAFAQNISPSGHWEGTVHAPDLEVKIEIDLAKNSGGQFTGTFGQPANGLKGLPISTISVDGKSVKLLVRADKQPAEFDGDISDDGKSISGNLSQAGYDLPFNLTRTGDAKFAAVPVSAAIGKELEGTWTGTLDSDNRQMRLILKLATRPGGTSSGTIMSPDGSGVEIPVAIAQKGSNVTIDVPSTGASFAGELKGAELSGNWSQSGYKLPLVFRQQ